METVIIRHCDKTPQTSLHSALVVTDDLPSERINHWAQTLDMGTTSSPPDQGLYLELSAHGVALCQAQRRPLRLRVDFLVGPQAYRARRVDQQREAIARACGISAEHQPRIVDATAGLGRDAFILAASGAHVTLLERSAIVAALLADGLARASAGGLSAITQRMTLHHADSVDWLATNTGTTRPDVVYIDPMYEGKRRAAAGKALALLHQLLGPAQDADQLLGMALEQAKERVVVKRHRLANALNDQPPHYSLNGRSTRFDVYRQLP